ncbi:MAG: ATP-dependent Clp protease ATP-binding subunit [Candidatus Magasanikbacteria bacterium]
MKRNPMEQLLEQLSTNFKQTISQSISFAASLGHSRVAPKHMLYILSEQKGSLGAEIISKSSFQKELLHTYITREKKNHEKKDGTTMLPPLCSSAKAALEKAMLLAYQHGGNFVGTEHLLYGLLESKDTEINQYFAESKTNTEEIKAQILQSVEHSSGFPHIDDVANVMDSLQNQQGLGEVIPPASMRNSQIFDKKHGAHGKKDQGTMLSMFTTRLTDKNIQKTIDPVIGRDKEIDRLIHILLRRHKNNPILVGEPGVGKTAIVEGFAKKITEGNVPDLLKNKEVVCLDLTLLIAGTIYRGEFESRLKQIIDDVSENPNIILFIDEIHNIIGAGSNGGTMDAANILKPALARGKLRCIGATTHDEYKKNITSDPALERRFQEIQIEEPSVQETIYILSGIRKYYEAFHNVCITDQAIQMATTLSHRYIHDNFLPDKAIDLLDEASASVRAKEKMSEQEKSIQNLKIRIEKNDKEKEKAILAEQFEKAMKLKDKEKKLKDALSKIKKEGKKEDTPKTSVTEQDIAETLGSKLNIQASTLLQQDWERLRSAETFIKGKIFGQEAALSSVSQGLKEAYLGISAPQKPFASFLFVGPSGTGKTSLAKELGTALYHDTKSVIKIDMSEFAEAHGVSKLLGSPAGYVGHKDRNKFLEQIKKRPYSIVLFDEVNKAHPDVVRLLLQILDEGCLTESTGKKIHFNHAIIILTTNLGTDLFKSHSMGFGETNIANTDELRASITSRLTEELGADLLGRISHTCIFSPLKEEHIKEIIKRNIEDINKALEPKKILVSLESSALQKLAEQSSNPDTGARNVENTVRKVISECMANILEKEKRQNEYTLRHTEHSYIIE